MFLQLLTELYLQATIVVYILYEVVWMIEKTKIKYHVKKD